MMIPMRTLILVCIVSLLTACVATYRAADQGVAGYRDLQLDKTSYYVEYTESTRTSWEQVHRFALRRCAELTKQRGYAFFDVLMKEEQSVYLESDVDQISVATIGMANEPPVMNTYRTGGRVEGRRVIYKIRLMDE